MNPYLLITNLLRQNGVAYEELDHDPVYTVDDAARVEGLTLEAGAKSLLLKAKDKFILVVMSGDKKLDSKKLKKILGIKDMRFASPAEVKNTMGCIIGACYPFGSIAAVDTFLDVSLLNHEFISLNPGVHDKTIKLKLRDYILVEQPVRVDVAA